MAKQFIKKLNNMKTIKIFEILYFIIFGVVLINDIPTIRIILLIILIIILLVINKNTQQHENNKT
jgi:hypothetical protein